MKLSKHPDSVPLQKIDFFPVCRAPKRARRRTCDFYPCDLPGRTSHPGLCGAPASRACSLGRALTTTRALMARYSAFFLRRSTMIP